VTQAQLGSSVVPPAAPAPHPDAEATQCVVCLDAPMGHIGCRACARVTSHLAREGGALKGGEGCGVYRYLYDTVVQRGGWSYSTVVLQLRLHGRARWPSTRGAVHRRTAGRALRGGMAAAGRWWESPHLQHEIVRLGLAVAAPASPRPSRGTSGGRV
jgi:hypothetical protein